MRNSSFLFSFFFIFIAIISSTSATISSSLSLPRYISETSIQSAVRPLSLSLNKEGFHRDLELSYLFDLPALRRALPLNNDLECRVALLLELPITSFIDQFQIQDLRRKEHSSSTDQLLKQLLSRNAVGEEDVQETITPDVLLLDSVDLEKPSFLIPNETLIVVQHNFRFSSTLLGNPSVALKRFKPTLLLPIHLRYQLPEKGFESFRKGSLHQTSSSFLSCISSSSSSSTLALPSSICTDPRLLLRLSDSRIPSSNLQHLSIICPSLPHSLSSSSSSSSSSSLVHEESWVKLPVFAKESLEFVVPVGDTSMSEPLDKLTILIYATATLLLLSFISNRKTSRLIDLPTPSPSSSSSSSSSQKRK